MRTLARDRSVEVVYTEPGEMLVDAVAPMRLTSWWWI